MFIPLRAVQIAAVWRKVWGEHRTPFSPASRPSLWMSFSRPCLVVPDRALRDEGTSYHYVAPAAWACARGRLPDLLLHHAASTGLPVHRGPTWTTDAPYRETPSEIERHRAAGVLSVEMEAAALMALAETAGVEFASLLHVTNTLATGEQDFHKGPEDIHERILLCCFDTFADALG
jgi:uridine phosphorylase